RLGTRTGGEGRRGAHSRGGPGDRGWLGRDGESGRVAPASQRRRSPQGALPGDRDRRRPGAVAGRFAGVGPGARSDGGGPPAGGRSGGARARGAGVPRHGPGQGAEGPGGGGGAEGAGGARGLREGRSLALTEGWTGESAVENDGACGLR